jgi:anti-anti-sigma factor
MECGETKIGEVVLLRVSGRIDLSNADTFRDTLRSALSKAGSGIVLDFSAIDYISSAGLRSLMIAFKEGKAKGKAFGIAALQPLVREIFAISRFDLVFPLFDTVEEAIRTQDPGALAKRTAN